MRWGEVEGHPCICIVEKFPGYTLVHVEGAVGPPMW